jgi:hypothetical protein
MGIGQNKHFYPVSDECVQSYPMTSDIVILRDDTPAPLASIAEPYVIGRRWIKIIVKDMNFYPCTP